MTLKQVYTIYNTLMKLHRKYNIDPELAQIDDLIADINKLNSEMDHPLCNDLTYVFYGWYRHGDLLMDNDTIKGIYASLWTTHRELLDKKREMGNTTEFWHLAGERCKTLPVRYDTEAGSKHVTWYAKVIWDSLERDDITIE